MANASNLSRNKNYAATFDRCVRLWLIEDVYDLEEREKCFL
jgi:hypothetical protein